VGLVSVRRKMLDPEYEIEPPNSKRIKRWMYGLIIFSLSILILDFASCYTDVSINDGITSSQAGYNKAAYNFDQ
jgi:hypothetical protein